MGEHSRVLTLFCSRVLFWAPYVRHGGTEIGWLWSFPGLEDGQSVRTFSRFRVLTLFSSRGCAAGADQGIRCATETATDKAAATRKTGSMTLMEV